MNRPGWNAIDRRRSPEAPSPCAYCVDPHAFGRNPDARFRVPPGGTAADLELARLQHILVLAWRERGRQPSTGQLRSRWSISKQVWSRVVLGTRWPGETALAALVVNELSER